MVVERVQYSSFNTRERETRDGWEATCVAQFGSINHQYSSYVYYHYWWLVVGGRLKGKVVCFVCVCMYVCMCMYVCVCGNVSGSGMSYVTWIVIVV